jgi:PqqD family protein of HPr-rel-A system
VVEGRFVTAERRYFRDECDAIAACALEDVGILYHRRSGQTHIVISPVPEILEALGLGRAAKAADVHAKLCRAYDLGDPEDTIALIESHLAELAALGLVRSA